jgi:hypothetical protein
MVKVIQADAINTRGLCKVINSQPELLKGFEFNLDGKLGCRFFAPFTPVKRLVILLSAILISSGRSTVLNSLPAATASPNLHVLTEPVKVRVVLDPLICPCHLMIPFCLAIV